MENEDLKKKRNNRFISLIEFIRIIKYIHYLINTKIYMYIYIYFSMVAPRLKSLLIINWRKHRPFTFDHSIFSRQNCCLQTKKIPSIPDPYVEQGSRNAAWLAHAARTPPLRRSSRRKITFESSTPKNVSRAVC